MLKNKFNQLLLIALASLYGMSAYALPSLQLGCRGDAASQDACYDDSTTTSILSGDLFGLYAYANCEFGQTGCDDPHGDYAWEEPSLTQYAYLVIVAAPQTDRDTGDSYAEITGIDIISLAEGADRPHFDLFDVMGERHLADGIATKDLVNAVAPYSHDAGTSNVVPEPGTLALLGIGLAGIGFTLRKKP